MDPASSSAVLPNEILRILNEFREMLVNSSEESHWNPLPKSDGQDTAPAWREHVAQLQLKPFYDAHRSRDSEVPMLVHETHVRVGRDVKDVLEHNITRIFRRGEPTFLANAAGTGKTSLLLQGLRKHWGFYFNADAHSHDMQVRSDDLWTALHRDISYEDFYIDRVDQMKMQFRRVILARLLLFNVYAETLGTAYSSDAARNRWNDIQLALRGQWDYSLQLYDSLKKPVGVRWAPTIRDTVSRLRVLLRDDDFNLFFIIDDCSLAYTCGRELGGGRHAELSLKIFGDLCATLPWLTLVFSGNARAIEALQQAIRPSLPVTSCTGASNPEQVRDFVRSYLPMSVVTSDAGKTLLECAGFWLRGRHKFAADFVQFFLAGKPNTMFDGSQAMLQRFITRITKFNSDNLTYLNAQDSNEHLYDMMWYMSDHRYMMEEPRARAILYHVLYQYLVLGHSPCALLDNTDSWAICHGLGHYADNDASKIVIDEPLILVFMANWLRHEWSFFSPKLIYNPDWPAFASPREHAVLLFSRFFATPHAPSETFVFPGKNAPHWAQQRAELVELRPGIFENGSPRYRVCRHADYPASAVLPLATDGTSYPTTLSWLRHEHDTAFCLLPDPTAFMFALRRFEGDYLWVIVRAVPHADFSPHKGGLGSYFKGKDRTADVSEALALLCTSLPNPCKALGYLPVLEVAMQAPDLDAPDRETRIRNAREALDHVRLDHIPLPSPYPNKHRIVTVNSVFVQYTEAMLEKAAEADKPWYLYRMVANIVGETSISPDRHGRRRKMNASPASDPNIPGAAGTLLPPVARKRELEVSASNVPLSSSSEHVTRMELPTGDTYAAAGKRKRSESPPEMSHSSSGLLDEVGPPSKRFKIDSKSPTPRPC